MKEAVIREKLLEISETIQKASQDEKSAEGVYVPEPKTDMEQAIDQLRLHIKYLMFDLEASRRENRYLRQMLEMRPPHTPGKDKDDNNDNNPWR